MSDTRFEAYLSFYESISPQSISTLRQLCAADIHFQDPFNDVRSVETYVHILEHMYTQVENPSFVILERAYTGNLCYIKWRFSFVKNKKPTEFIGMSELRVNEAGQIDSHVDYWDTGANIYAKVPVLGAIIGAIRKMLSASS